VKGDAKTPAVVEDKPIVRDDALEKPDKPEHKADPIIDPTDTHDPFKKHK